MSTTLANTRRRASSPGVATDIKAPSLTARPSTRKRKLNPELKDRVESFLSNANPSAMPPANSRPKQSSAPKKKHKVTGENPQSKDLIRPVSANSAKPLASKTRPTSKSSKASASKKDPEEKRLRVFRNAPPQSYLQKLERAQTQRMFVLNRKRLDKGPFPSEDIELVGSTGNVYTVTIGLEPKCTCPDYLKGNQCKHIVYSLVNVLKAPPHLQYQLAFLSSELREIFATAHLLPTRVETADDTSGKRKSVEGECPICYMDFDEDSNELVWCRAACGNNMHKSCFDQWAASQRGSVVKCVYCRTPWQSSDSSLSKVAQQGIVGEDGYLNVAHLTGQSTVRDVSTYHPRWVRRNYYGMNN